MEECAPGGCDVSGLHGDTGQRDVQCRAEAEHVHGEGNRRFGRRRRRECAARIPDAAEEFFVGLPAGNNRGAGRQRQSEECGGGLRHEYQPHNRGARAHLAFSDHAEPEPDTGAEPGDPAGSDGTGRRNGGGLHGDPGKRDVRGGRDGCALLDVRDTGPGGRGRRGPADRLRARCRRACAHGGTKP